MHCHLSLSLSSASKCAFPRVLRFQAWSLDLHNWVEPSTLYVSVEDLSYGFEFLGAYDKLGIFGIFGFLFVF